MIGLREFFERLPKDGWVIPNYGLNRGLIRRRDEEICPVCAAAPSGKWRLLWKEAAKEIHLPESIAKRIAAAADGEISTPTIGRIRRLLLKHCGLTEPRRK